MKMITLTIEVSKPVDAQLERLLQTGLFGLTKAEVAERVICKYLEPFTEIPKLKLRPLRIGKAAGKK